MADYSRMTQAQLQALRDDNAGNQEMQQAIAPYEHRAYAREIVGDNPLNALSMMFAIPGYQAVKSVGGLGIIDNDSSTTPSSWDQMAQGYTGVGEGLQQSYTNNKNKLLDYVNSFKN